MWDMRGEVEGPDVDEGGSGDMGEGVSGAPSIDGQAGALSPLLRRSFSAFRASCLKEIWWTWISFAFHIFNSTALCFQTALK